ncbi:MAG TPA: hypothetical protein VOB72_12075 [Candidatus Dormibacteraeota bacterium]|nr:hypothetical protein [Candidatus Dormibacteraeota bacterium]
MMIRIWLDEAEPPVGRIALGEQEPAWFEGWLQLLGALRERIESAGSVGPRGNHHRELDAAGDP